MLNVVSSEKATQIIREKFSHIIPKSEIISIDECENRVLFGDITARENVPCFDRSTVDGYAVKARDTFGSGESMPCQLTVIGEILMGDGTQYEINDGECMKISTGGRLPKGADSVVMVEYTESDFDELCLIFKAVSPFENVTRTGDDVKANDVILKNGTVITERHTGILASLGISELEVYRKLRVGIISTGDEIIDIDKTPNGAQVRDVNSYILSSLMKRLSCSVNRYGIIKDNYDDILCAMQKAVEENEIILISGGSSAGARDMTAQIIGQLGDVFFHGIAIKPGKPTIGGKVNEKAVFGLPGHPAAAYFVSLRFVKPLIEMLYHKAEDSITLKGKLTQNISSNHGREEIVCVKYKDGLVQPVFAKSGIISLLGSCNGYIIIDRDCEGLKKGDEVVIFQ